MTSAARQFRRLFIFLLLAVLAVNAWSADYQDPAYQAAVADAKARTAAEISRELWAITAANPWLEWEGAPGASRVKMTFWTGDWVLAYEGKVLRPYGDAAVGDALFMFPSTQLRDWFRARLLNPSARRIEQLLGLPPETGKSHFAEIWVSLDLLLRPSPDPETSDHEAELDFPGNQQLSIAQSYKDWFTSRLANIYNEPWPYPFTGLGYTYDWGNSYHVGLSEFVVLPDQPVEVIRVYSNQGYFAAITPR